MLLLGDLDERKAENTSTVALVRPGSLGRSPVFLVPKLLASQV